MLKKLLAFITVFALVFSMTACGSKTVDSGAYDYDLSEYVKLGDYMGIEVQKVEAEAVTSEAVDTQIQSNLEAAATTEKIDAAAENGDTVNIDYEGTIDGKVNDNTTAEGQDLILGSGSYIDGFESGLVGKKAGDVVTLNLTFPDDYDAEELQGKDVTFKVTINSVSREKVPTLTDEWVKNESDSGCKDIAAYKEYVKAQLEEEAEETAKNTMMNDAWQTVYDGCEILKYPETELEETKTEMEEYYTQYAEQYGMELADFLEMAGMDEEGFQEELQSQAEQTVAQEMIFYAIARAEGIELTQEEYDTGAQEYVDQMGFEDIAALEEQYSKADIEISLLANKVIEYILDNAKIVEEKTDAAADTDEGTTDEESSDDDAAATKEDAE